MGAKLCRGALAGLAPLALACLLPRAAAVVGPLPEWLHEPLVYFPLPLQALLAGLAVLLARWRRRGLALAVLLALGANALLEARLVRSVPAGQAPQGSLRLLSYNVFQARWADDEIVSFVLGREPDVLLMQEVPADGRRHPRHRHADQQVLRRRAGEGLLMIQYKAAYYHDPASGWYTAKVLDFPGVLSQGRTLDTARRMLGDALRETTEWLLEEGEPLPAPDPAASDGSAAVQEPIRLS